MNKLSISIIVTFFITGLLFISLYFYKGLTGDPISIEAISLLLFGVCFIGVTPFVDRMVEELKP